MANQWNYSADGSKQAGPISGVDPAVLVKPLETVEIKPKSKRNAVLLVVGCLVFVLGSISLLVEGSASDRLSGIFGLVFFGGGGLWAFPKLLRRRCSLRLSPAGVEQITIYGAAKMPWSDIEAVGTVTRLMNKMLGIRLSSYDRYLEGVSDELADNLAKSLPLIKWLAKGLSVAKVPKAVSLWSKLTGDVDLSKALKAFGKVGDLAGMLLWNRSYFKYDILFAWSDMDRPAEELQQLLQEQHAHYTGGTTPKA